MPKEFEPKRVGRTRVQSGIPMRPRGYGSDSAHGLMVRGVVVATYILDDPNHPQADNEPVAVYCDVLAYTSISGMQQRLIPYCLVPQERGGMHSGSPWVPRAATIDSTGNAMDFEGGTNPGNVDGDHVLVGFMDDNMNLPVIMRSLPHPSADIGNENRNIGQRLRLVDGDGSPDFQKWHGSFRGIDTNGNWVVDTRYATDGTIEADGKEPAPPTDGKGGHYHELPNAAEQVVTFYDMSDPDSPAPKLRCTFSGMDADAKWELEFVDSGLKIFVSDAKIELGAEGAADMAVLDSLLQTELERLKSELEAFKTAFDAHTHPDPNPVPLIPSGPSLPTLVPTSTFPAPASPGATNSDLVTIDS